MLLPLSAALLSSLGVLAIPARRSPAENALAGTDQVAVRIVETAAEFAALQSEWEALHDDAASGTIFNSWLWQYRWWELYGAHQPLRLLVAVQAGTLVGILPLYIRTASVAKVRVRELRLIGTGGDTYPDDLGPVVSPR